MFCKVILNSGVFQAFHSADHKKDPEKFAEERRAYTLCNRQPQKSTDDSERTDENNRERINVPFLYINRHSRRGARNEKRKVYALGRQLFCAAGERQIDDEQSPSADSRSGKGGGNKRNDNIEYLQSLTIIPMPAQMTSSAKMIFIVFEFSLSSSIAPMTPPGTAASIYGAEAESSEKPSER